MDIKDQLRVFKTLKNNNKRLHPGLEIIKAEWPIFILKPDVFKREKRFSIIIIKVLSPEAAN